jgi:uncharacterized protein YecE (DUF72 family)
MDVEHLSRFYAGLSGLVLPVPKYLFPPLHQDSSRLTYYATFFNSLEVNSTFYKLPMATTVSKWAEQVPDNFKFTFKLWKEITHVKNLDFKENDVQTFFRVIESVGHKKGCVLVQFPPSLGKANIMQLDALLQCIALYNRHWNIAVEFRNRSWYNEEVYELIASAHTAIVIHDIHKSATPMIEHSRTISISVFMVLRAITAIVIQYIFWQNIPLTSKNGWSKAKQFMPTSIIPWAMLLKTWKR